MTEGSRRRALRTQRRSGHWRPPASTTRTMSDDLLTHLPDLGDLPTQRRSTPGSSRRPTPCGPCRRRSRNGCSTSAPPPGRPPAGVDDAGRRGQPSATRRVTPDEPLPRRPRLDVGARRRPAHAGRPARRPRRRPRRGRAARRAHRRRPDPTGHERDLVTRAATELDRVGGLLQSWTTTAVESAARVRALEPALTRCDLTIDGRLVVERSGPSRVEPGARLGRARAPPGAAQPRDGGPFARAGPAAPRARGVRHDTRGPVRPRPVGRLSVTSAPGRAGRSVLGVRRTVQ